MSDVRTAPGTIRVSKVKVAAAPNATETIRTSVLDIEAVKHLLVNKPLRGQSQRVPLGHSDNDRDDIAALETAKAEGPPRPYDEFRRELGLGD